MDEENLENKLVSRIQNDGATDVTDAQAEKNFSDSALSNDYLRSPASSMRNISAGEVLEQYSPNIPDSPSFSTQFTTGADVLNSFQPNTPKCDSEGNLSSNDSTFKFTVEGASDAVKYFFPEYKNELESNSKNDEIDASPNDANPNDVETPTSTTYKGELDITTDQSCDASSKKERMESQYRYNMNHPSRGCFVIFNQENFDDYNRPRHPAMHLGNRTGTRADSENLEHMARQLGFQFVRTFYDLTTKQINCWINELATANHSDYDCFGCAILTHGGDRDILFARDAEMKLSEFTRPFGADVCPTLAGKPKLFFIQACRGSKMDPGGSVGKVVADHVDGGGGDPGKSEDEVDAGSANFYTIPAGADYLIANSTMPEHYSFRNQANGSIFVQNICAIFNNFGDSLELMQLMTRVNRMMAYDFESSNNVAIYHGKKQIPSIATRLTAEVYFPPKKTFREDYDNTSSKSKMEVDGTSRTKSTTIASDCIEQGSQAAFLREARYETKQKSFYPKQPSKKDGVFTPSTTAVPVSTPDQGYRDRLEVPRVNTGVPIRRRSSTITIPHRIKSEEDTGPTWSTSRFHKSSTEPVSIEQLRKEPGKRLNANRHSFPESKRLVKQDTDNILLVGGKKTNVQYEESDI